MTSSPRRSTLIALIPALVVVSLMLSPTARGDASPMRPHGAYVVASSPTACSGAKVAHPVRHGSCASHHARAAAHARH